jgi:RNA polymerase sigma-70 factor (TIGR02957 family)
MTNADNFELYRPLLFSIAYRMLGSANDADDVVQDVWMRYAQAKPSDLRSLKAWLTTVATRLCLDRLKSARATREQYVGPWLPEPVLTSDQRPDAMLQRHESVTLAFLVLLETLSPEERAVFLLKEVFEYSHEEIADMLDMSAANSRQLLHRAKERIAEGRPRVTADESEKRELARRFVAAFTSDDATELKSLLADDVRFFGDGGGKVAAARRPLIGRDAVVNLLHGINRSAKALGVLPDVTIEVVDVNFEPAFVIRLAGRLDSVYSLEIAHDAIRALRVVRNPDKLTFIDRQLAFR